MTEIFIYDEIGPEWAGMVGSKTVLAELDKAGRGSSVVVRLNSPGGDVVEAQSIYNAMRRHSETGGKVTVEVDALAASAASYVAMAGDVIRMAENSLLMIHNAWTIAWGNAEQLRGTAAVLDKFDGIITDTYAARSNYDRKKIVDMMAEETWLTAKDAIAVGLADEIGTALNIAANVKAGRYPKMPDISDKQCRREADANSRIAIARAKIRLTTAR